MIIKCDYCDGTDNALIYLPDNERYEIRTRYNEYGEREICLILNNKEIILRDVEFWAMGRKDLPISAIECLYDDIVSSIQDKLMKDPKIDVLDIDEIEEIVFNEKYKDEWCSNGYIDENDPF